MGTPRIGRPAAAPIPLAGGRVRVLTGPVGPQTPAEIAARAEELGRTLAELSRLAPTLRRSRRLEPAQRARLNEIQAQAVALWAEVRRIAAWSLALFLILPIAATAQVRYRDAEGVVHFVESLEQVPPAYRGSIIGGAPGPAPKRWPPTPDEIYGRIGRALKACPAAMEAYDRWVQENWQKYGRRVGVGSMYDEDIEALEALCRKTR